MAKNSSDYLDTKTERAARTFLKGLSGHDDVRGAVFFGSRARRRHRPDRDADVASLLRGQRGAFPGTKLALARPPTSLPMGRSPRPS